MVQKGQGASVPLQAVPVNKQENRIRKKKGRHELSLACLGL